MARMGSSSCKIIEMARNENSPCTLSEMDKMGSTSCKTNEMGQDENTWVS